MKRIFQTLSKKWPELLLELIVITVGILAAYGLNNWSQRRAQKNSEMEILSEIKSNLNLDLIDLKGNRDAHKLCLGLLDSIRHAGEYQLTNHQLGVFFHRGFRDFVFLPQTSAFETLKAKGVDLISNDSLRVDILRLYDFYYNGLVEIEGHYEPSAFTQDFRYIVDNYFNRINLHFDSLELSEVETKYAGYDWLSEGDIQVRIDRTALQRQFMLSMYDGVITMINDLTARVDEELE